jgi:hypothetical protein
VTLGHAQGSALHALDGERNRPKSDCQGASAVRLLQAEAEADAAAGSPFGSGTAFQLCRTVALDISSPSHVIATITIRDCDRDACFFHPSSSTASSISGHTIRDCTAPEDREVRQPIVRVGELNLHGLTREAPRVVGAEVHPIFTTFQLHIFQSSSTRIQGV